MSRKLDWFYKGKRWKQCRDAYARAQYGICEQCGEAGRIVHHRKHLNETNVQDAETAYGFSNLELLCQRCHNQEHFQTNQETGADYYFDAAGDLHHTPRGGV